MAHVSADVANAITRQKARYGRYADTKEWDKFANDIALPDAVFAFLDTDGLPLAAGPTTLVFDDPKSCAAFFARFFRDMHTLHNFGPGDFEQVAPDEVKGVFGFEDQLVSKHLGSWAEIRGGGFYYETWKLVDGEWYIKDLKMRRTYQKMSFLVHVALTISTWLGVSLV